MNISRKIFSPKRRGMTLSELLLSITIMAVLGVGATNMILGGLRTDNVLLDSNRQVSEIELSIRRLQHNLRGGSSITMNGTVGCTLSSQADPSNNGQTYTITYLYDANAKTLSETSSQFSNAVNVIAYNVTAFSITQTSSTAPLTFTVDITIRGNNATSSTRRVFQITNRNS